MEAEPPLDSVSTKLPSEKSNHRQKKLHRKGSWGRLLSLPRVIIRCLADLSFAPLLAHLEKEWNIVKRTILLAPDIVLILAAMCIAGGFFWKGHRVEREITDLKTNTAFLGGIITDKIKEVEGLKMDVKDSSREYYETLTQLKIDDNEVKRQKDADIARLTIERDAANMRAAVLESSPSNALSAATNFLGNLNSQSPQFHLFINEFEITNGSIVKVPPNREMHLKVANFGETTASQVVVALFTPEALQTTNLVSDGWQMLGHNAYVENGKLIEGSITQWSWAFQGNVGFMEKCMPPMLKISTNVTFPVIQVLISVHSDRSLTASFSMTLDFRDLISKP